MEQGRHLRIDYTVMDNQHTELVIGRLIPGKLAHYSDTELAEELVRRERFRNRNQCDWCGMPSGGDHCEHGDRHSIGRFREYRPDPKYGEGIRSLWVDWLRGTGESVYHRNRERFDVKIADIATMQYFRGKVLGCRAFELWLPLVPMPSDLYEPITNESEDCYVTESE